MKKNQRVTHQGRKIKKYLISQSTFRKELYSNIPSHIFDKIIKAYILTIEEYYNHIHAIDLPHITLTCDNTFTYNRNINKRRLHILHNIPYIPFTKHYLNINKRKILAYNKTLINSLIKTI